ncbi:MAG: PilZ domain-containing protein [Deltaproteobacteria bacterium]|nr:PilZ domain-containing protein [Deltaproteobacteria bacterium]
MDYEDERRGEPRMEVNWPVKIFMESAVVEGEARNISSDGIYIRCDEDLHLGDTLSISVSVPNHDPIQVAGKVMWSDFYGMDDTDRPVCIGMCFVEMREEDRRLIGEMISACEG